MAIFQFNQNVVEAKNSSMCDNIFVVKNNPTPSIFSILKSVTSVYWQGVFDFSRNKVYSENGSVNFILEKIFFETLIFDDNYFEGDFTTCFQGNSIKTLLSKGTTFNSTLGIDVDFIADAGDFIIENGNIEFSTYTIDGVHIPLNNNPTAETWYELNVSYENGNGFDNIFLKWKIYDDVGTTKISTYNDSNVLVDEALSTVSNFFPKVIRSGDWNSGASGLLVGHPSIARLLGWTETTEKTIKTIKLKVYQGVGTLAQLIA